MAVVLSPETIERIEHLHARGLPPLDAAHVAFAEAAGCYALLTCGDRLIRRAKRAATWVRVINQVQYEREVRNA